MKEELKKYLDINKYTVGTFEDIIKLMTTSVTMTEIDALDKIISVLDYLKVPEEIIDELNANDIADIISHLGDKTQIDFKNTKNTIEINKRTYTATHIDDFVLKGRMISKVFKQVDSPNFPSYILAVIFKDDLLDVVEHLDDNHIKHKQKLFKDVLFMDYYEYVIKAQTQVIEANRNMLEKQKQVNE